MDIFSHHAYRLHGEPSVLHAHIRTLVQDAVSAQHIVQYVEETADTLSVDSVRSLQERLRTRVGSNEKRIALISFATATQEAQNALLKMSEEPGDNTVFFFITPSSHALLPTLRSRTQHIPYVGSPAQQDSFDIEHFISAPYPERFKVIEPLIEEKNKERMVSFVNALEGYTVQHATGEKRETFLRTLELVRSHILDRGCSPKLLLDICAVYAPKIR